MALPVVFSMVISLVYNMADTYFVAKTMNTNLVAGVSLCAPIFTFMIALGDIFGIGGSSVISRLFGQQMNKEAKNVSGFCFYASILCGIVVTILMFILKDPILNFLGVNKETWLYASQYYNIIVLGSTFIILSLTPSNLIRTEGLATLSMIGTVSGSILNIISSISPRLKSRGHKYFINKFFFHALCVTMKKRWYTTEHVRVSRYSTQ